MRVPPIDMMNRSVASSMLEAVVASMPAAAAADNSSADSGADAGAGAGTVDVRMDPIYECRPKRRRDEHAELGNATRTKLADANYLRLQRRILALA
jgi:hypothetical protein